MKMFLLLLFFWEWGGGLSYNIIILWVSVFLLLFLTLRYLYPTYHGSVIRILIFWQKSIIYPVQKNKLLFCTEQVSPASVTYRQTDGHSQNVKEVTHICQPAYTGNTTLCLPACDTRSKGYTVKSLFVCPSVYFNCIPCIHQSLHKAVLQRCIIWHF